MQNTGTQNAEHKRVCTVKLSSSYKVQNTELQNLCLKDALTPKLSYKTGTLLKALSIWKAVIQVSFILCFNLREQEKKYHFIELQNKRRQYLDIL